MTKIDEIVAGYTERGIDVPQETVERLIWYCNRKMDAAKIGNREEYLPLLFKDEIKNYFFRAAVNMTTIFGVSEKEEINRNGRTETDHDQRISRTHTGRNRLGAGRECTGPAAGV